MTSMTSRSNQVTGGGQAKLGSTSAEAANIAARARPKPSSASGRSGTAATMTSMITTSAE